MAETYAPRAARTNEIGALPKNGAPPFLTSTSAAMPYVKIAPDRAQVTSEGELDLRRSRRATRQAANRRGGSWRPSGRQFVTGYVTGFTDTLDFDVARLKPISRLLKAPLFDEKALQVARWMSAYYHCALGECLACYVPNGARQDSENVTLCRRNFRRSRASTRKIAAPETNRAILFDATKTLSQKEIEKSCGGDALPALRQLVAAKIVEETDELQNAAVKPRLVLAVQLTPEAIYAAAPPAKMRSSAPQQARALELLLKRHFDFLASTRDAQRESPESAQTPRAR